MANTPKKVPVRLVAVARAEKLADLDVRERGGNNRGWWIKKFLQSTDVGLDQNVPWCAAFVSYCLKFAGYRVASIRNRASVGFILSWAKAQGYVTPKPWRGDLICFHEAPGAWPYHIGFVRRRLRIYGYGWLLLTVEGNTSSGEAGSQDDGDGVFKRVRTVRKGYGSFIRIPGLVNEPEWLRKGR
jgi:hypothetical protein